MKAEIKEAVFKKEFEYQGKKLYEHQIVFIDQDLNQITAQYVSQKKEQDKFKEGIEAEFNLEERSKDGRKWFKIKPIYSGGGNPNYNREKKREQTRYSGFAMSYAKDLVIADKVDIGQILPIAEKMFNFMVELDKRFES